MRCLSLQWNGQTLKHVEEREQLNAIENYLFLFYHQKRPRLDFLFFKKIAASSPKLWSSEGLRITCHSQNHVKAVKRERERETG